MARWAGLELHLKLGLVALAVAFATTAAVATISLKMVESELLATLDRKALAQAFVVREDVERALDLGIPLEEIRGMWEYTESIPANDPDIRFVTVTDPQLKRAHYGGIGRRRLDPLLADPALLAQARETDARAPTADDAVEVNGFSISTVPLVVGDDLRGYVAVAVQRKQLRARLLEGVTPFVIAAVMLALMIWELVGFVVRSRYLEPLLRLGSLMQRIDARDGPTSWSGRHRDDEIGRATLRFNATMHRLRDRCERLLLHADEVQKAVFDSEIAARVGGVRERIATSYADRLMTTAERRPDPRPSDVHPALWCTLMAMILLAAGSWPLRPIDGMTGALMLGLGILAGGRLPVRGGWWLAGAASVGAAILAVTGAPDLPLPTGTPPQLLVLALAGFGGGAAIGASDRYGGLAGSMYHRTWLAGRCGNGIATGILLATILTTEGSPALGPQLALGLALIALVWVTLALRLGPRLVRTPAAVGAG